MMKTILIPVFNSELTINSLVETIIGQLGNKDLQVVLVNDGSKDGSDSICLKLSKKYPSVITYINLAKNFGEHNAVMAGLNYAQGEAVVIMDDDFQNPPEEVTRLFDEMSKNQYDVIYTYSEKKQHSLFRNLGSKFNELVANFMIDKPKGLYLSSFKCLNRMLVKEIIKYKGPFPYIDGLVLRCTNRIGQIRVEHKRRDQGESGYTLRKLIRLWLNMFFNFSIGPLRVSVCLGLFFTFIGLIGSILTVIDKLLHPGIAIGWASLIIVIMTFSGVQLIILGLIGEYLGRLFLTDNETPQFVIREVHKDGK
ncbi:MAG: glycosyltransferase family 2 protein [Candidatus Omnitrophica bacterium]|nr:glycosyltransferase family 2 protein [Candidatus Omnitrophota bacterium]